MIIFFEWGDATARMARDVALLTLAVRALLLLSSVGVLLMGVNWIVWNTWEGNMPKTLAVVYGGVRGGADEASVLYTVVDLIDKCT